MAAENLPPDFRPSFGLSLRLLNLESEGVAVIFFNYLREVANVERVRLNTGFLAGVLADELPPLP